jgi:uncharacterized protein YjiS (DUF1127 family)
MTFGTADRFGRARSVWASNSAVPETFARVSHHLLVSTREETIMPTFDLYLPRTYSTWRPRPKHSTIHPFAAAWVLVASWIERARQREALAQLDDHTLRDIGVTRAEAARESGKPFWR